MKNNKLIIIFIFLFGTALRLYCALTQPLWLDEIYSLYFAHSFSFSTLFFHPPELHPGGYFLLLKSVLLISSNLFFLRTLTSILPIIIATYLLYRQTHHKLLLIILLFNPFFIHMSWQLRMYGLTFLFSILLILPFLNSPKTFHYKRLLIIGLISTLFTYSLIIPIFCLYLYQYSQEKKLFKLLPFLLIPLTFFLTKGFSTYKTYVESASWISPPSLSNIPSTLLTSFGFSTDINNQSSVTLLVTFLFYLFFIPLLYFLSKKSKLFFYFFVLPLLTTVIISLLFPFLSERFFFYHFIPKISLFIPRFLLPLSIYFYIFIFSLLKTKKQHFLLLLLLITWIIPNHKLNIKHFYVDANPIPTTSQILLMPPWENLRLNPNFSSSDLNIISQNFNNASNIEAILLKNPQLPDCSPLSPYKKIIYIIDPSIKTISKYHQNLQQIIKSCTTKPLSN